MRNLLVLHLSLILTGTIFPFIYPHATGYTEIEIGKKIASQREKTIQNAESHVNVDDLEQCIQNAAQISRKYDPAAVGEMMIEYAGEMPGLRNRLYSNRYSIASAPDQEEKRNYNSILCAGKAEGNSTYALAKSFLQHIIRKGGENPFAFVSPTSNSCLLFRIFSFFFFWQSAPFKNRKFSPYVSNFHFERICIKEAKSTRTRIIVRNYTFSASIFRVVFVCAKVERFFSFYFTPILRNVSTN